MRTIKINCRDGRVFYGEMKLPEPLANRKHVSIVLDEKIQITDAVCAAERFFDTFTFNPATGALVIRSGSPMETESDLFLVDTFDMPRLDEFAVISQFHSQR